VPTRSGRHAVEEAELVARLRAGDERAFEALVEAHRGALIAPALTYVRLRARHAEPAARCDRRSADEAEPVGVRVGCHRARL
jgi:hypothetical protein